MLGDNGRESEESSLDYDSIFRAAIDRLHDEGRYRVFIDILRTKGSASPTRIASTAITGPKPITVWCSNDYLGMGQHPAVVAAMEEALHSVGAGSGGTRNIGGNTHYHVELESRAGRACTARKPRCCSPRGYVSNEAALSTLGKLLPGCIIFSDELNHASMIAGIRNSGCEKRVFRHNDLEHLEQLLEEAPAETPKLIAFESVYSMDGDIAPIAAICDLADRYGAHHLSRRGPCRRHVRRAWRRDSASATRSPHRVTLIEGTLGKAFGVMGGYVAADKNIIDCIRSYAPGFIFTTSLSPVLVAGALASVRHLKASGEERAAQQAGAAMLKAKFRDAGLPVMDSVTHIVPLLVGCPVKAKRISDILLAEYGLYVQPINFPTVPRGTERLRFTPGPTHSEAMMDELTKALVEIWDRLELELRKAA